MMWGTREAVLRRRTRHVVDAKTYTKTKDGDGRTETQMQERQGDILMCGRIVHGAARIRVWHHAKCPRGRVWITYIHIGNTVRGIRISLRAAQIDR